MIKNLVASDWLGNLTGVRIDLGDGQLILFEWFDLFLEVGAVAFGFAKVGSVLEAEPEAFALFEAAGEAEVVFGREATGAVFEAA